MVFHNDFEEFNPELDKLTMKKVNGFFKEKKNLPLAKVVLTEV